MPSPPRHVRFVVLLVCLLLMCRSALANSVDISIGTAPLSGVAGTLAFDFIDGDGIVDNTISIENFASDATLSSGIVTGSVSGSLPGTVTLSDGSFFNELLVPATFGSSISFTIDYTNVGGTPPDAFTFFLLDDTAIDSLVTTNLSGNALLEIDMNGNSAGSVNLASNISPTVTVSTNSGLPPPPVPEPSSFLLAASGISTIIGIRKNRRWTRGLRRPRMR